jgi:hypothetical protein
MGGELEINAVFPDQTVAIENFSSLNNKTDDSLPSE